MTESEIIDAFKLQGIALIGDKDYRLVYSEETDEAWLILSDGDHISLAVLRVYMAGVIAARIAAAVIAADDVCLVWLNDAVFLKPSLILKIRDLLDAVGFLDGVE